MRRAKNLPTKAELHPWIAVLWDREPSQAMQTLQQRLTDTESPELLALAERLEEFTPYSIECADGIAYLFCSRLDSRGRLKGDVVDNFYISQPPTPTELEERVAFYDKALQPLMKSFWSKYAGAGEEMSGEYAGQFLLHDAAAKDYDSDTEARFGKWKNSKVLYHARNGDLVLIDSSGATAWHVMETNENLPLTATFPEFLVHYAAFLGSDVFDSWASRDFLSKPQLRIHR